VLLVSQSGKLMFEHYGRGQDQTEGRGWFGPVTFAPDVPHDLRSVSKSIVGLAYGIALAAGKVPPPEANLYDQFPEYADLARAGPRSSHHPSCAEHDARLRLGRADHPLWRSA
jgi:hypothetical protein